MRDLGEEGLIARIGRRVCGAGPAAKGVLVGIGDDAAVLARPGRDLVATCDLLVEGVHFLLPLTAPADLGHKALAASLSDVAAMGGSPRYALVSLGLPGHLDVAFVDGFYDGLGGLAAAHGVTVVGGDTTGSPGPVVVDVFVLGEVLPGGPFRCAAARPGQVLLATGSFGAAAAGLAARRAGVAGTSPAPAASEASFAEAVAAAWAAHARPRPRLAEAAALAARAAASGWVPAARDASDGLAAAARALARASGCGIELDRDAVPVAAAARALAPRLGLDPLDLALHGGEDYELVFTAPPEEVAAVERLLGGLGTPVTVVGRVVAGDGVVLTDGKGWRAPLPDRGFRHFGGEPDGGGRDGGGCGGAREGDG